MGVSISTVKNVDTAINKNDMQEQTHDKPIRKALLELLADKHAHDHTVRVIEELGLNHGLVRVDVAVVNGVMHGYEIKSDLDTLERLPEQMKTYNRVFNKVTIVVGWSHLEEVINIVPEWWGIIAAKDDLNGKITLGSIRSPGTNLNQDPEYIARLLWRNEALETLEAVGQANGVRSKSRRIVYERLARALSIDDLQTKVREVLFFRPGWRVDQRLHINGG